MARIAKPGGIWNAPQYTFDSQSVHLTGNERIDGTKTFVRGPRWLKQLVTSTTTLISGSAAQVVADTTLSAFTVKLPAAPAEGDWFILQDAAGQWALRNVTLDPNGKKLDGSLSTVALATANGSRRVIYDGTQWHTESYGNATLTSAPVTSVFGRVGAVVATSGDYSAAQVTNAADKASVSTQTFAASVTALALSASGLTGAVAASRYAGATASVAPSTGTFALGDFVVSQTGHVFICTVAGSPGTWVDAGGGAVSSVFGRVGAVVATSGDYTAAQVTNAADKASGSNQTFTGNVVTNASFATNSIAANNSYRNFLLSTDTQAAFTILGDGTVKWGLGGATVPDAQISRTNIGQLTCTAAWIVSSTSGIIGQQVAGNFSFRNFLLAGDANPSFSMTGAGSMNWGSGGATAIDTTLGRTGVGALTLTGSLKATSSLLSSGATAGVGYATGAGGAVTQITSRTTAVTLNNVCGRITTNTTSLATGATAAFVVNNTNVAATDTIILNMTNNSAFTPLNFPYAIMAVAAGSFTIAYTNNTGSATVVAYIFNFAIVKAVNA